MQTYNDVMLQGWAKTAWKKLGLEPPLDLHMIADMYHLKILRRDLGSLDEDISGVLAIQNGVPKLILVNSVDNLYRQRFTIAHEIAEALLIKAGLNKCQYKRSRMCTIYRHSNKSNANPKERSCDRFAAALLMPDRYVRQWFYELAQNVAYRIEIMSERFQVSKSALLWRLQELGLDNSPYRGKYHEDIDRFWKATTEK
jgi:Zn-dependent peptidase ImmA (M78 family)